jgi:phosphoribosylformylglycinamidine (FGAM) synthase-like enzyme
LAVALAEMAFAGGLGVEADLHGLPKSKDCARVDAQLFSESNSRYIVEVEPAKYDAFASMMLNLPFGQVGKVKSEPRLVIRSEDGQEVVDADLDILRQAWQRAFDW